MTRNLVVMLSLPEMRLVIVWIIIWTFLTSDLARSFLLMVQFQSVVQLSRKFRIPNE